MADRLPPRLTAPLASAVAAALLLAACADRRDYPTLGQRPVERATDDPAPPPAGEAAAATDAAIDAQAAAQADQAVAADAAFARLAEASCRTIATGLGASEGSEAWIASQQALSALDAARGPVRAAAAELDRLLIDRSGGAGAAIDTGRIAAASAEVSALDAAEQARVEASRGGGCGA